MASENAKAVARDIIKNVRKHTKIVKGKIIKKRGYKTSVSKHPKTVTETESYKKEMKPFVDELIEERDRARKAMEGKISQAKYRDLTDAIDKLTKNIQLLSGGSTEDIKISWDK